MGPHLVPGPSRSNAGSAGLYGFPLGTAAECVGHGEGLPPTSAPQRELRGGTPLGPGPGPVPYWIGWALRIPTEGTSALNKWLRIRASPLGRAMNSNKVHFSVSLISPE